MRKGVLGSIAALAAGASSAWGQVPGPVAPVGDPPPPAAVSRAGDIIPVQGPGGAFRPGGPAPVIMPPLGSGPPGDPAGLGPIGNFGPPPGPMYPTPGPYAAPLYQPAPSVADVGAAYGGAPRWWVSGDYLLMWNKSQPIRFPLATTSAPADAGLLGRPSTFILAGEKDLSYNSLNGFRITTGFYGDADRRYGFETTGWMIAEGSNTTTLNSNGLTTLARPFLDSANPRAASSLVIAGPGFASGSITVDTHSKNYSIEANGLVNLFRTQPGGPWGFSLDVLAGYRYLQLDEDLSVRTTTTLNIPNVVTPVFTTGPFGVVTQTGTTTVAVPYGFAGINVVTPTTISSLDSISVVNQFNGGQVGLRGEARYGMLTVTTTGKLAFGLMHQRLNITGNSSYANGLLGQNGTAYGGLLANASNIGSYNHDEFAIIPEVGINMGLNLTRGITAYLGYNFMYIDRVARPGSQINPIVNSATVPMSPNYGTIRPFTPQNLFSQDDYWLMGVNFGFQIRY